MLLFTAAAPAQYAPAGNEHPETPIVSGGEGEVAKPFGEPEKGPRPSREQKAAFAQQVDLSPLRATPVFHRGRVKVLDTLARETVRALTSRRDYQDYLGVGGEESKIRVYGYDPLFTLFDTLIDTGYYIDKPLIAVDYLPLRRSLLEAQYGVGDPAVDPALKVGRLSPIQFDTYGPRVAEEHMDEPQYRQGLGRADDAIRLFLGTNNNMLLVTPETRDAEWLHLATLPADHPARVAAAKMGESWRAMDAAGVNAAAAELASALAAIHPGVVSADRANLELLYNRTKPFEYGYWAYFLAALLLLLSFGTGRKWLRVGGVALLFVAVGLHAAGFIARCIIAERFAIQNQFESMTGLSLFASVLGTGIMLAKRQWLFGAASAMVGFVVLIAATQLGIPGQNIEREAAILNTSVLLKYHVTTVLVSYGLIAMACVVSLFYLGVHYYAPGRVGAAAGRGSVAVSGSDSMVLAAGALGDDAAPTGKGRLLSDLDRAQMIVLQLAFWTLGVGILLGAWWADHSWGRFWAFDSKETWALVTWIVYLIVIHMRFAQIKDRGLTTAWLSVVGFIVMLWTYFGVNLLLPGLHAYA